MTATTHETEVADIQAAQDQLGRALSTVAKAHIALDDAMKTARANGMTLQAIGDVLGLSRQRVKQLLDR